MGTGCDTILAQMVAECMDCDVEDGNLDNYTYFLRRSLRKVGSRLQLATVRGVGYRLEHRHG